MVKYKKKIMFKGMKTERLNTNKHFSRILRLIDFDIPTGAYMVMNGGTINYINYENTQRILDMSKYARGHVRPISYPHLLLTDGFITQ
jgi:hypothetical protein